MIDPPLVPAWVGRIARGEIDTKSIDAGLAETLIRHNLAPAVAPLVPSDGEPTPAERLLIAAQRQGLLQMMAVLAVSQRVSGLLEARGIRCLWLKGPALALQTTGRWDARNSCDVDLLIDPADCGGAHDAFAAAGLSRRDGGKGAPGGFFRWAICEAGYHGTLANIDLHWRLDPSPAVYGATFEELWERSEVVEIEGKEARTLGRLDAWLFTAVHGARSDWIRWSMVLDAVRQACGLTAEQRVEARRLAKAVGCDTALAVAEALAARCLAETMEPPAEAWALERADRILASTGDARGSKLSIPASLSRRVELARAETSLGSLLGSLGRAVGRVILHPGHYRGHVLESLGLDR